MGGDASRPQGEVTQRGPAGPEAVPQEKVDAGRLTARQLAKLLARAGSVEATEQRILADVAAGAPVNDDGTIGMVKYAAWLSMETSRARR